MELENITDKIMASQPTNPDDILDICFLLDITGSMSSYIEMMGKCLNDLVYYFSSTFYPKKVYMSFVGYRDFGDNEPFVTEDFANIDIDNVLESQLYKKIEKICVSGGADLAEDIRGGIKEALKFKWRSVNKFVVLIADAPTHGKRYCEPNQDDHQDEDIQDAIDELIERKIAFFGVKFVDCTEKMYNELEKIYKEKNMDLYFAMEDMKDLMKENRDEDIRARRFMDLIATKIKATMFQIFKANKAHQIGNPLP